MLLGTGDADCFHLCHCFTPWNSLYQSWNSRYRNSAESLDAVISEVRKGLMSKRTSLAAWLFYEDAGYALSILISCLLFGRETHASATQSDPLLLPTRNGPYREDGALRWEYLFSRVQHPPP